MIGLLDIRRWSEDRAEGGASGADEAVEERSSVPALSVGGVPSVGGLGGGISR